jgi:hypothetical protein
VHLNIVLEEMSSVLQNTAMDPGRCCCCCCKVLVQRDLLKKPMVPLQKDIHTQGKVPMHIEMQQKGAQ